MEVFLPTNPLPKSLGDVEEPPLDFNKTSRPKIANKAVDENDIALFLSNWKRRQLYLHFSSMFLGYIVCKFLSITMLNLFANFSDIRVLMLEMLGA